MDEILGAVELTEVRRPRQLRPFHRRQLDRSHEVQDPEGVRRRGRRRGADLRGRLPPELAGDPCERRAEVADRWRGRHACRPRRWHLSRVETARVDANHGRAACSTSGRREDEAVLEGRGVDVQGHRDLLTVGVAHTVQPLVVVSECNAIGLYAGIQDRLVHDNGVRGLPAWRPRELLLLEFAGQHFHEAMRARMVVDRALLPALPTQQQRDVLSRGVAHDVTRIPAAAEDRVLLPLAGIQLRVAEHLAHPIDDVLIDGRPSLRLGGQLSAQALVEATQVQAERRQVLVLRGLTNTRDQRGRRGRAGRRRRWRNCGRKTPAALAAEVRRVKISGARTRPERLSFKPCGRSHCCHRVPHQRPP
mmetsp:Transcript_91246/g.263292  ORF Transcript_91246/g.263292 Transcript_91246/m.263292 type:complete len:362 (-) Transcript_91246:162-1247(-)